MPLGEGREAPDVEEEHRHLDLLAGERGALAEDVLGDVAVDVGPEGLADALALAKPLDHAVEARPQQAHLAPLRNPDFRVEVPTLDLGERGTHRLDGIGNRASCDPDREQADAQPNRAEEDRRDRQALG